MNPQEATALFYAHVWPHRAMVVRTARFLTRDVTEADDLAQETLVKAFKSMPQFDLTAPGGNVRGWLSAILRHTWIDRLRASGRAGAVLSVEAEAIDVPARAAVEAADAGDAGALLEQFSDARIIKALQGLPEEIRWTLLLVDVEAMDQAQAAEILGVPEGTVKSRAFRGRRMMREALMGARATEDQR
jgi:RNA polymerase sigma-70 factor (ECF subfamily)